MIWLVASAVAAALLERQRKAGVSPWPPLTPERRALILRYDRMADEQLFAVPTSELDLAAWGLSSDQLVDLPVELLVPTQDMDDVFAEIDARPGHWDRWMDEPIEVKLRGGRFLIEDGHHRFGLAQRRGQSTLPAQVEPDDNPIPAIRALAQLESP